MHESVSVFVDVWQNEIAARFAPAPRYSSRSLIANYFHARRFSAWFAASKTHQNLVVRALSQRNLCRKVRLGQRPRKTQCFCVGAEGSTDHSAIRDMFGMYPAPTDRQTDTARRRNACCMRVCIKSILCIDNSDNCKH